MSKKSKTIVLILILVLLGSLSVEHFKQGSDIKMLRAKEKALTVKINHLSKEVEQLVEDTLQYSNKNSSLESENASLTKQNVLIKSAFKKRDEEANTFESKLALALNALEEAKKEKAAVEEQLAVATKSANEQMRNHEKDTAAIAVLGHTIDTLTNIRRNAEIPKKCLEELRHRFSPRIACLTGGIFEPSCEKIANKVRDYLPPLSEEETKTIYSDKAKQLRKIASSNSVSPELLFLVAKLQGFNPPQSICPDQTKQILKSSIENGDFDVWCMTLFNIPATDVANAKAVILNIHKKFE